MAGATADLNVRTLYDDWQARRRRLAETATGEADRRAVELRLLDYLLRRYQGSPEAARPARFPLPTGVFVNHRAIVVHHHLGRGVIATITNQQEAQARVQAIVQRMQTPPAAGATTDREQAVASWAVPPEDDPLETARMNLCDADPAVRIHAALELGKSGSLDDIGLLSDLLSLPIGPDEHPREREALLYAMQRLSGRAAEPFDMTGLPPLPRRPANVGADDWDFSYPTTYHIMRMAISHPRRFLLVLAGLVLAIGIVAGILLGTAWIAMVGPR